MKRLTLILAVTALVSSAFAQTQPVTPPANPVPMPPVMPPPVPAPSSNAPGAPAAETKITFVELTHSFGKVIEGEIARYEFKFTNDGDKPLKLTSVNPSCGCTSPKWPREEIAPGQSAVIIVEYNSQGRPGSFTKYVTVNSNGSSTPITLTISGEVISEPAKPKSPVIIGN